MRTRKSCKLSSLAPATNSTRAKYLRTLLIQAAKVLLMRPHNWARYSFGAWLKTALERLHPNKLAVALANKLARIAWSVLRYDKAFDTHLEVAAI
jgi:transposase